LPVPLNASPELSRDLSQFFPSCSPDDFFDPGHPELTISGVDSFWKTVADDSEKVTALKSKSAGCQRLIGQDAQREVCN
jgi:hypothetical protein